MILEAICIVLISAGCFLFFTGTVGLLRLPDFYCRMHATGKCDTLGALLVLLGLAIFQGCNLVSLKILLIAVFIFLANPTATHAIGRAGLVNRVLPWTVGKSSEASPSSTLEKSG